MKMEMYNLFPTMVLDAENSKHQELKTSVMPKLIKYIGEDGYSGETKSPMNLQQDSDLSELYSFITHAARMYLTGLCLDPDDFNFNITKSWMNAIQNFSIGYHCHPDAHLSCSYYMNVPKDYAHKIVFHNYGDRHEPYPGCIRMNNPSEWNSFNSYTWGFEPKEGHLFLFPSNLSHSVDSPGTEDTPMKTLKDLKSRRISIATDIILTYKNKQARSIGFQPVSEWRTFK